MGTLEGIEKKKCYSLWEFSDAICYNVDNNDEFKKKSRSEEAETYDRSLRIPVGGVF